jgi:RNA polymerase sigma-70 factor (ECF subfamily)
MDFEEHRDHLRAVAMRMLGSSSDADDAVQEAWLRMHRSATVDVRNQRGWLTTVVARICLDMLRARSGRREEPLDDELAGPAGRSAAADPEQEAVLADSIGVALLVVLQTLSPVERLAVVLHDMFDVPFAEIAPMVGRSENTTAQLAARARRRLRGASTSDTADLAAPRRVVDAFLAAARDGDLPALLAVLDDDVVLRADAAAGGVPTTVRGARSVAASAHRFSGNARFAEVALVDGAVGVVVAPDGVLAVVLRFTVTDDRISVIDILADPDRLRNLHLAVLA